MTRFVMNYSTNYSIWIVRAHFEFFKMVVMDQTQKEMDYPSKVIGPLVD
jgi:hypothetical protein